MYGGRESTNEGQAGIHGWVAELPLFGRSLRVIWVLLLSATVAMEVFPRDPAWGPQLFYSYTAIKAILFFLLGFFTPLAIWAFRSLGLGILIAAFASGAVEGLSTSWPATTPAFLNSAPRSSCLLRHLRAG